MQLRSHEVEVQSGGMIQNSTEMTVASSEKIFEIFTSSVYTFKIRAFVRELMTNCLDAHIEAGYPDKPFLVTPPDRTEPTFRTRDYGLGLSPERMEKIYPVLFKSTKDLNNIAVGGFGIGSKSPLCYVDSFTVKSFFEGKLYIYTVYKSGSKIKLDLLSVVDSDEPSGVEVSVPIRSNNIYKVEDEIKRVSLPFDVKPIFTDGMDRGIEKLEFNEHGYTVIDNSSYSKYDDDGIYVRIGCVIYPIDLSANENKFKDSLLKKSINNNSVVIIDIPVGHIDIQPSREELDYTEHTQVIVTEEVNRVVDHFDGAIDEIIDSPEYQDHTVPYAERYFAAFERIRKDVCKVGQAFFASDIGKFASEYEVTKDTIRVTNAVTGGVSYADYKEPTIAKLSPYNYLRTIKGNKYLSSISPSGNTHKVGAPSHHKYASHDPFKSLTSDKIYVNKIVTPMHQFSKQHEDIFTETDIVYFYRNEEVLNNLKRIYGNRVIDLNRTITKPKKQTVMRDAGQYKVYDVHYSGNLKYVGNTMSKDDVIASTDDTYYVVHKYAEISIPTSKLRAVMHKHSDVIAIPSRLQKEAENNPNWKHISSVYPDIEADIKEMVSENYGMIFTRNINGESQILLEHYADIKAQCPHIFDLLLIDGIDVEKITKSPKNTKDELLQYMRNYMPKENRIFETQFELTDKIGKIITENYSKFMKHYDIIDEQIHSTRFWEKESRMKLERLLDMIRSYNGGKV